MREVEARMFLLNSSYPSTAAGSQRHRLGHLHKIQYLPVVQIQSLQIVQLFEKFFAGFLVLHPVSDIGPDLTPCAREEGLIRDSHFRDSVHLHIITFRIDARNPKSPRGIIPTPTGPLPAAYLKGTA